MTVADKLALDLDRLVLEHGAVATAAALDDIVAILTRNFDNFDPDLAQALMSGADRIANAAPKSP